ncbi:hypothetical protein BCR42DRAFT_417643 [Absidia repens]|uniref:COP9 signalosome complex subunit 4 n=1 Tax=Absidia repens TaxID=90262 RepID=A0A1X2IE31_9FUNG|nr:hypothetical protein BCR42DRAFT_417643 [Absidia repens]
MDITAQLSHCLSLSQQKEKIDSFRSILETILSSTSSSSQSGNVNNTDLVAHLKEYVNTVLDEQVGLVNARQLLKEFIDLFSTRLVDHEVQKQLLSFAIERAQPRVVSFEEQLSQLREKLASIYEQEEDFLGAAKILQGIALDSGHRSISDEYKLQIYIRIVRLLLEEDEAAAAESYLNRAGLLIPNSTDLVLNLTFKLSQARILDAKRRFLEACSRYHELSYVTQLDEDEQVQCLTAAVQCAVLAGAGPQRSRSLATLYKDERTHRLSSFSVLEKTYLDRVIRANEVAEFATTLKPHHLARLADNTTTVFDRAMIEHNLVSASKIYTNISFRELGTLLNVSSDQAEHVAAHMIGENRLGGNMDQLEQLITFIPLSEHQQRQVLQQPTTAATTSDQHQEQQQKHVGQSMQAIINWDHSIQTMCNDLDTIIATIQDKYPEYVAQNYRSLA